MLRNLKLGLATVLCSLAPAVFASGFLNSPYIGLDVIQTNQNYRTHFGQDVFRKNVQYYGVYAGFKFNSCFGLEAAYEFQPKRSEKAQLNAGQSAPGGSILGIGQTQTISSTINGDHPYVGLFLEAVQKNCLCFCMLKWQILAAASFSYINATSQTLTQNGVNVVSPKVFYQKHKVVAMGRVGVTAFVFKQVGLRIFADYRNLSEFNIPGNALSRRLKMRDEWGGGLGLTYLFFKC